VEKRSDPANQKQAARSVGIDKFKKIAIEDKENLIVCEPDCWFRTSLGRDRPLHL